MSDRPVPEGWKSVRLIIKGRVQGVSYRYWAVGEARNRHLDGWVCNRRDGTVEAAFGGPAETVDEMIEACKKGPPASQVTEIEIHAETVMPEHGFRQLPTA
jgi:acylphosphatase